MGESPDLFYHPSTDHRGVFLELTIPNTINRGQGYWRLSPTILRLSATRSIVQSLLLPILKKVTGRQWDVFKHSIRQHLGKLMRVHFIRKRSMLRSIQTTLEEYRILSQCCKDPRIMAGIREVQQNQRVLLEVKAEETRARSVGNIWKRARSQRRTCFGNYERSVKGTPSHH